MQFFLCYSVYFHFQLVPFPYAVHHTYCILYGFSYFFLSLSSFRSFVSFPFSVCDSTSTFWCSTFIYPKDTTTEMYAHVICAVRAHTFIRAHKNEYNKQQKIITTKMKKRRLKKIFQLNTTTFSHMSFSLLFIYLFDIWIFSLHARPRAPHISRFLSLSLALSVSPRIIFFWQQQQQKNGKRKTNIVFSVSLVEFYFRSFFHEKSTSTSFGSVGQ